MPVCKFCLQEIPRGEFFRHLHQEHPDEMKELQRQGGLARQKKAKKNQGTETMAAEPQKGSTGSKNKTTPTPNLVEAALLQFVGQTIVVPNTPALVYGYFCAKKYGFEGSVGEFIQEVIDDFFQARDINYYEEVQQGWEGIGRRISQEEQEEEELAATRA